MEDEPPPRKQLRLLVKGREKVGELLRRRSSKKKNQKNAARQNEHNDSDVEDEVPILSRIADPASVANPPLRIKLKVTAPKDNKDNKDLQPYPASQQPTVAGACSSDDKKVSVDKMRIDEKAIKAQRRRGIIGMEDLKDRPQAAFSTQTVMARHRPLAIQPSSQEGVKFTFNSNLPANGDPDNGPSFGLQSAKIGPALPGLQQAARGGYLESSLKPGHDVTPSQAEGATVQAQNAHGELRPGPRELADQRITSFKATSPSSIMALQQQQKARAVQAKRLFDSFKLGANGVAQSPRFNAPDSIESITDFVRPQIPHPELAPAIYRSFYHKPMISRSLMQRSLPDNTESQQFLEDVEIGRTPAKKTEKGDVPALVHDAHTERVPLGARNGVRIPFTAMSIFPGNPVMQPLQDSVQAPGKLRDSSSIPENLHTEPNRLAKAYLSSAPQSLKRKRRADTTLPPASFIHQHTARPTFNVFSNGILLYPELCLLLAADLPVQTLINLYSISKDYHVIINQRLTTVMLNQASLKAPAAMRCYPWRCYASLCQPDPSYAAATVSLSKDFSSHTKGSIINIAAPPPAIHESTLLPGPINIHTINNPLIKLPPSKRKVPTFRWLQMALHREKTMHEIYQLFAARGVPLPGDPVDTSRNSFCLTLHKLWFAFDIPDNTRRMVYFKSPNLITPYDLANVLTFLVKIDMVSNDPAAGEKRDALRKLFMGSVDGFDTLRRVLKHEIWTDELEVLRAWTRYGFQLDREDGNERAVGGGWVPLGLDEDDHAASDYVFGIPRDEVGLLKKEFWGTLDYNPETRMRTAPPVGRITKYLMRPDQIVIREAVRRGMRMGKQFLHALMYGYVDEVTLGPVAARDLNGGRSRILEEEGEYGVDDLVGGVRALRVEDGGDPLLDLGDTWEGSVLTVKHVGARKQQVERIKEESDRLEAYKQEWKEDVEREEARRAYRGFTYVDG